MGSVKSNLIYAELRVRNLKHSVRFYRALGLSEKSKGAMKDGTSFVWMWDKKTRQLVELWYLPKKAQLYERFRTKGVFDHGLAFTIPDFEPLFRLLAPLGAKSLRKFQLVDVNLNLFHDPDGHVVEVLSWVKPREHIGEDPPLLSLVTKSRRR